MLLILRILINKQIGYIICVIGALAQITGMSCSMVYKKLQNAGIITDYLVEDVPFFA